MRFSPRKASARSLALSLVLFAAGTALAGDGGFLLELELDDKGYRGSIDVHGWLTVPERVSRLDLSLSFDSAPFAQTRLILPDSLLGPGLASQAELTASGAESSLQFDPEHAPEVGNRTQVFTLRLCLSRPSPEPTWEFPLEIEDLRFTLAGSAVSVAGEGVVPPPIRINWGSDGGGEMPCYNEPPTPQLLRCVTQPDGKVVLTWQNPVEYTEIEVTADRQFFLPGDATSWTHEAGGAANNYVYEVRGYVFDGERSHWSEQAYCAAGDPREPVAFIRGDANQDGLLSTADMVAIERWAFTADGGIGCLDAVDLDDDGQYSVKDSLAISQFLFGLSFNYNGQEYGGPGVPSAPFPDPGIDPTHAGEARYMSCESYSITPAETTSDVIRVGDVESSPGSEAFIPVYLTNDRPVEAVQLVVRYDPSVIRILSGERSTSFEGTFYGPLVGKWFTYRDDRQVSSFVYGGPSIRQVDVHEEDGIFTASIVGHLFFSGLFEIPPGQETLVAKIKVEVSPDVPAGTVLRIDPDNGPDGAGYGPFKLHNELTYKGNGRYATILPRPVGGLFRIGVDGDISFFVRGDANGDSRVDISDAISVLGFLFLGDSEPACMDGADADDSGDLLITDAIAILGQLFSGGVHLAAPFPEPGVDPKPDFLKRCEN